MVKNLDIPNGAHDGRTAAMRPLASVFAPGARSAFTGDLWDADPERRGIDRAVRVRG
jgi:hypothetical protein